MIIHIIYVMSATFILQYTQPIHSRYCVMRMHIETPPLSYFIRIERHITLEDAVSRIPRAEKRDGYYFIQRLLSAWKVT